MHPGRDAARRTPLNPWDTRSPLCVGLVLDCASFSLGRCLPSTASAEGCPSLFGGFTGTTQRSDSCNAYTSAVRLCAFADRPVCFTGTLQVSRFSCMLFLDVHGVFDHAASRSGSRFCRLARMLPSPYANKVGTRFVSFRG